MKLLCDKVWKPTLFLRVSQRTSAATGDKKTKKSRLHYFRWFPNPCQLLLETSSARRKKELRVLDSRNTSARQPRRGRFFKWSHYSCPVTCTQCLRFPLTMPLWPHSQLPSPRGPFGGGAYSDGDVLIGPGSVWRHFRAREVSSLSLSLASKNGMSLRPTATLRRRWEFCFSGLGVSAFRIRVGQF